MLIPFLTNAAACVYVKSIIALRPHRCRIIKQTFQTASRGEERCCLYRRGRSMTGIRKIKKQAVEFRFLRQISHKFTASIIFQSCVLAYFFVFRSLSSGLAFVSCPIRCRRRTHGIFTETLLWGRIMVNVGSVSHSEPVSGVPDKYYPPPPPATFISSHTTPLL